MLVRGLSVAALLMFPQLGEAQTVPLAPVPSRIFVDLNLVGTTSSGADPREFTSRFVTFAEAGFGRAAYPTPSRASLIPMIDVGAGYMAGRSIALGAGISRASFEDAAGLSADVPHPTFLNASARAAGVTDRALSRTETAVHVFVAAVPLRTARFEFRLFGGPSLFWFKGDLVKAVSYTQTFDPASPASSITITGFESELTRGRGYGFHLGSDFAYFVSTRWAVKAGMRYSQANVATDHEPLSKVPQEIRVGGTLVFLGARMRFGG
jgi:hypothetical protein